MYGVVRIVKLFGLRLRIVSRAAGDAGLLAWEGTLSNCLMLPSLTFCVISTKVYVISMLKSLIVYLSLIH